MLAVKLESDKARYYKERQQRSILAEEYRKKMLDTFVSKKQEARERNAAQREEEEAAEEMKLKANEAKVEDWLKKKRETMKGERDRQLAVHRVSHRKNMKNLKHIKDKSFGNSDFSEPKEDKTRGYRAPSVGAGAKLVKRNGRGGSGRQQTLYGKNNPKPPANPRVRPVKDQFYAPPTAAPSFGISGTKLR